MKENLQLAELKPIANGPKMLLLNVGPYKYIDPSLFEPVGVEQLAGTLRKYDVPINMTLGALNNGQGLDEAKNLITEGNYQYVGLGMPIGSLDESLALVQQIAEINRNKLAQQEKPISVFLGGNLASNLPVGMLKGIVRTFPFVTVVRGWGDQPLVELLKTGTPDDVIRANISGLIYVAQDGTVHENPLRVPDNSFIPGNPLRVLLSDNMVYNVVDSEDCPWAACTLCARMPYNGREVWRPRPIEDIVGQMEDLSRLGKTQATFAGEESMGRTFDHAVKHIFPLTEAIMRAKKTGRIRPDFQFAFSARSDAVVAVRNHKSDDILSLLKEAGLNRIFLGIESGVPDNFERWDGLDILPQGRRYNKGIGVDTHLEAIRMLQEHGIGYEIGYIMFDPLMDLGEILANTKFLLDNHLTRNVSGILNKLRLLAGSRHELMMDRVLDRLVRQGQLSIKPQLTTFFHFSRNQLLSDYLHPLIGSFDQLVFRPDLQINQASVLLKGLLRADWNASDENPVSAALNEIREQRLHLLVKLCDWTMAELRTRGLPLSAYDVLAEQFDSQPGVLAAVDEYKEQRRGIFERLFASGSVPDYVHQKIQASL